MVDRIERSEDEWRAALTAEQFRVTREAGTEAPGTGELLHEHRDGSFSCVCCGAVLFASSAKFESGSGWPSFTDPADREHVTLHDDDSHGMRRTEVRCAACDAHLGHVFPDGPGESGLRYCVNSCALAFSAQGAAASTPE